MKRTLLTVAIPTYNRNEVLIKNLRKLIPVLTEECELLILDNHSSIPVENILNEKFPSLRDFPFKFRILRHDGNRGACANIVYAFEKSSGEWTWLLGDDDEPLEDSIVSIIDLIRSEQNSCFINFSSVFHHNTSMSDFRLLSFLQNMDSFPNVLFISVGVYKTELMRKYLFIGYNFTFSAASHLAMLFNVLKNEEHQYIYSQKEVVSWSPAPLEDSWNWIKVSSQLFLLMELPYLDENERRVLSKKISSSNGLRSFRYTFAIFSRIIITGKIYPSEYYQYRLYFVKWIKVVPCYSVGDVLRKIFGWVLSIMLNSREISFFLLKITFVIFRKNIKKMPPFSSLKKESF